MRANTKRSQRAWLSVQLANVFLYGGTADQAESASWPTTKSSKQRERESDRERRATSVRRRQKATFLTTPALRYIDTSRFAA